MGKAEKAFEEAKRRIAEAKRDGAKRLDLSIEGLQRIPEELVGLASLIGLDLSGTDVTDISALGGMTELRGLVLSSCGVTDISTIAGLRRLRGLDLSQTGVVDVSALGELKSMMDLNLSGSGVRSVSSLTWLSHLVRLDLSRTAVTDISALSRHSALVWCDLSNTRVSDISALAGYTSLVRLDLSHTSVTDVSALAGMKALKVLKLSGTDVSEISALANLTSLKGLDLTNTFVGVISLRNIGGLEQLVTVPEYAGLRFEGCAATREDARIEEISRIERPKQRARALFEYLGMPVPGEGPEPKLNLVPNLPARIPAPLEVAVGEVTIAMAGPSGLPVSDANARAALGWEALQRYRLDFAAAFSIHNYAPLPAYLASFDREMGEGYDPRRVIGIGMQGQRIIILSKDAEFLARLPDGAGGDLRGFAAAIATFVNRFPDWVLYEGLEELDDVSPAAVRAGEAEFRALDAIIFSTPEAREDVKAEYRAEVAEGTDAKAGVPEARGLVASTHEVARALAEDGLARRERERRARNAVLARKGGDLYDKTVLAPVGISLHVMKRMEGPLRKLAKRFPKKFGWLEAWYDHMFPPSDGEMPG